MKKECVLCNSPAKMYCESDEASLCWNCDFKIHSANFLVAKHVRTLLCHVCRSPTPWTASGPKLGSALCVCQVCVGNKFKKLRVGKEEDEEEESVGEESEGSGDSEEQSEDSEEEDGENQVVPLSSTLAPVPPTSSCSSDSYSSSSSKMAVGCLKRMRSDLNSQDDLCCSSSSQENNEEEATSLRCLRPTKAPRREEMFSLGMKESGTTDVLVNSLRKFHQQLLSGTGVSGRNFEMCKSSNCNPNPMVR